MVRRRALLAGKHTKTIDEIKALMSAGEIAQADVSLKELLTQESDNLQAKMIYGTCRQLLGDEETFRRIHDELAPVKDSLDLAAGEKVTSLWRKPLWSERLDRWVLLIVYGLILVGVSVVSIFYFDFGVQAIRVTGPRSAANGLFYLSGRECLSRAAWWDCILKLKMDEWASHSSMGVEISRHYSTYYYVIVVFASLLVVWIILSILKRRKGSRRIFSKRIIIDVIMLFLGVGVVYAITFLPQPSVLAKIEQERRFLSRSTRGRFETPYYGGAGYVVLAEGPTFEARGAIPMLDESYGDYVERCQERSGVHISRTPEWWEEEEKRSISNKFMGL